MNLSKILCTCLSLVCLLPCSAELPILQEKPWLGHFVGYERRGFRFGIKEDGRMTLEAKARDGKYLINDRALNLYFEVIEVSGDRTYTKKVIEESLTTTDTAAKNPSKATFRGKVTGDAEFEATVEFDGDTISLGGRILSNGSIKNPLQFQVRARHSDVYRYSSDANVKQDAKRDRIEYVRLDKKKGKAEWLEGIDLSSNEVSGQGLASACVQVNCYEGREFLYTHVGSGKLTMQNTKFISAAPRAGFSVLWRNDAEKDPEGKGRFQLLFK